jgi:magnesium transporter
MQTKRNIGNVVWVDLLSPTSEDVRSVINEYGIDPRAMQDIVLPTDRPIIEKYGEFVYFVLHFPSYSKNTNAAKHEIDFILSKNFILTARYENIEALYKFEKISDVNSITEHGNDAHDSGALLSQMLLSMYKSLDDGLESIKMSLDEVENGVFKGEEKDMVFKLSKISRELLSFRHALEPHGDVFYKLYEHGINLLGKEFELNMNRINSGLKKITLATRRYSESLAELRRTNDSLLETKQNEIMKIFTGITVISSVLTIISSWFLVESKSKPFGASDHAFWYVGLIMLGVAIVLGLIMKKKKWL